MLALLLTTASVLGFNVALDARRQSPRYQRACAPKLAIEPDDTSDDAEAALRAMMAKAAAPSASDYRMQELLENCSGEMAARAADARATELYAKARARADLDSTTTVEAELSVEAKSCAARTRAANAKKRLARDSESIARAAGDERAARIHEYDALKAIKEEIGAVEDEVSALTYQDDALTRPLNLLGLQIELAETRSNDTARRAYTRRLVATRALVDLEDGKEQQKMRTALEQVGS